MLQFFFVCVSVVTYVVFVLSLFVPQVPRRAVLSE